MDLDLLERAAWETAGRPLPSEVARAGRVARLAGVRRETLKFAYLVLRADGRSIADAFPPADHRVVSARLTSKGRDEVFVCGARGRTRVLRNRRDKSVANAVFDALGRGALVKIEGLSAEHPRVERATRVFAFDPGAPDVAAPRTAVGATCGRGS